MVKSTFLIGIFIAGFSMASASPAAQSVATQPPIPVPSQCAFSQPAHAFASLVDVPEVAAAFRRLEIDVADVGEPFIPFDVVDSDLPHRQFVRAYEFSDRMIVWYFHGGFATHFHVIELRRGQGSAGSEPVFGINGRALSGPLCQATQALLDGVASQTDW